MDSKYDWIRTVAVRATDKKLGNKHDMEIGKKYMLNCMKKDDERDISLEIDIIGIFSMAGIDKDGNDAIVLYSRSKDSLKYDNPMIIPLSDIISIWKEV